MPAKGITISVTAETNSGGRRHMEDYLAVRLSPNESLQQHPDLREQAYIGVFDGHGGKEAAKFARERLWDLIQLQPKYLSTDLESIRESIEEAFVALHHEMEPLRVTWKRNKMGDLSTAGTTASTVIFRQDNIFVANVGDSTAVLAVRNPKAHLPGQHPVTATVLTKDHKPEDPEENKLIESLGGRVMLSRKGVPRVVWERQRSGSDDDTDQVDLVPFLSVSRSLGDFWSFSRRTKNFVVSPKPDVHVHPLEPSEQKFIVVATDGLWNVMSPQDVVEFVWDYEHDDQKCHQPRDVVRAVINEGLQRWKARNLLADNIAVLIAFLSEDDSCQTTLSGLSNCTSRINGEVAMTSEDASSSTPSPETGITSEPRENPESSSPVTPPSIVKRVSQTKTGSTVYYKESLADGVTVEYQTTIKLRHRRKEKNRARDDSKSKKLAINGRGLPRKIENRKDIGPDSGSSTVSPLKRRQLGEDLVEPPPPVKRVKVDPSPSVDSGCETAMDVVAAVKPETEDKSSPLEEHGSDSSSGVFSDENEVTEGLSEHALHSSSAHPEQAEMEEAATSK